jgi:hypothetical protein
LTSITQPSSRSERSSDLGSSATFTARMRQLTKSPIELPDICGNRRFPCKAQLLLFSKVDIRFAWEAALFATRPQRSARAMRLPITVITVVAVLVGASGLLLGCGGDDDNSDEEAITEVWDQFAAAVGQRDGERACSYLSEQGQKFIRGRPIEMTECAERLSGAVVGGGTFARIPSVTVSEITVTGDTGTVTFEQPQGGAHAGGGEPLRVAQLLPNFRDDPRRRRMAD